MRPPPSATLFQGWRKIVINGVWYETFYACSDECEVMVRLRALNEINP